MPQYLTPSVAMTIRSERKAATQPFYYLNEKRIKTINDSVIKDYRNIDEYLKASMLLVEKPLNNFLVYSFADVNANAQFTQNTYRHHYFEVSLEITECCSFEIDHFKFPLQRNRLTVVAPNRLQSNQVHKNVAEPSKGFSMFFERDFLGVHFDVVTFTRDFHFLRPDISPSFLLSDKQLSEFVAVFELMKYEQNEYKEKSEEVIRNLISVVFEKTRLLEHINVNKASYSPLVSDFLNLCNQTFLRIHSVKEYASVLSVTPKHLTEMVKEQTGMTVLETIHSLKIGYAKGLLQQTDLSVKQIAYELGFHNPEYFNVFFKKLTGKTPNQFRQM